MQNSPEVTLLKNLFCFIDTDDPTKIQQIEFPDEFQKYLPIHGMGMTCLNNTFCLGIIPFRERLTSSILIIDLISGISTVEPVYSIKGIHSIFGIDDYRFLANSTQTDQIVEVTIFNNKIEFIDVVYSLRNKNISTVFSHKDIISYHIDEKVDDNFHLNSVFINSNKIYFTRFCMLQEDKQIINSGNVCYVDDNNTFYILKSELNHPHSVYVDSQNNILFCNSANFELINFTKNQIITCPGYTRGICEDKSKGGYWVGISAYRKFSKTQNKWVSICREDIPKQECASIQFITYDGELKENISINTAKEIFEIIPFKEGNWGNIVDTNL
jgi:hypothetical protein